MFGQVSPLEGLSTHHRLSFSTHHFPLRLCFSAGAFSLFLPKRFILLRPGT